MSKPGTPTEGFPAKSKEQAADPWWLLLAVVLLLAAGAGLLAALRFGLV